MCPHARSCSCHPALLMLLPPTASFAPNFILIGAGLVWQTMPAGWVDISESHYTSVAVAVAVAATGRTGQLQGQGLPDPIRIQVSIALEACPCRNWLKLLSGPGMQEAVKAVVGCCQNLQGLPRHPSPRAGCPQCPEHLQQPAERAASRSCSSLWCESLHPAGTRAVEHSYSSSKVWPIVWTRGWAC